MAKEHIIPITNGKGSKSLVNGNYSVTASVNGYDNATIEPSSEEISEGVNEYSFTISATGTLTLHVSDDGTDIGVPIVGATFYRCDAEGTTYGEAVISGDDGNAVFNNVPYADDGTAPNIYYKQTASDGEHGFTDELQTITMEAETHTVEIANEEAQSRDITLTDANYDGLPIEDGSITLTSE